MWSVVVLLAVALAPRAAAESADHKTLPRVFMANLNAGNGATAGEASLMNDAVLVAARRFESKFEIRTSQDIEGMVKLEAQQALAGCDVVSCAAEIGDALGADQLVTGQLGRVGNTWLLSLTRTERSSLKALSRTQVRAEGKAPDVLFPLIEAQLAEVFGEPLEDAKQSHAETMPKKTAGNGLGLPLLLGGGGVAVVGAVGLAIALGAYLVALDQYDLARNATDVATFKGAVQLGENANAVTLWSGVVGASLVGVGMVVAGASFVVGEE